MRLGDKQEAIFNYLREVHAHTGVYPSIREIAEHVGFRSTNTVHYHLRQMEKSGWLRRTRNARTYEILRQEDEGSPGVLGAQDRDAWRVSLRIPILGRVAAGAPILAEQNFDGFVNLTDYFAPSGESFALRVRGDSMIEAGIFDGDLVIVRSQPTVLNGEIAVVIVDGEATVKRLYEEADAWRLEPANQAMAPMCVPKREGALRVAGKVIGVLRKL